MLDFLRVATRQPKKGVLEIYPKFIYCPSSDLMVRGGDFYAIWDEKKNLWSTDENVAVRLIDTELEHYANEHKNDYSDFYVKSCTCGIQIVGPLTNGINLYKSNVEMIFIRSTRS